MYHLCTQKILLPLLSNQCNYYHHLVNNHCINDNRKSDWSIGVVHKWESVQFFFTQLLSVM